MENRTGAPTRARQLDAFAASELEALAARGLLRSLRTVDGLPGPRMRVDGRSVLMFASSNYLDLAAEPSVLRAADEATRTHGAAAGGSRLICGNLPVHEALERALAHFTGHDAALLFSTGYMANLGVLGTLAGPGDTIVSDSLNHASIIDACRLSGARTRIFRHNDPDDLRRVLRESPIEGRGLLVLDGVYSMDGDRARLSEMVPIAREHELAIVLDDVHGVGVLGKDGLGTAELENVEVDVIVGNLGKAFGSFGAFATCSHAVRELLLNRARPFVFTCGLAPGPVGAALRALELIRAEPRRRETLLARAGLLRTGLQARGFDTGASTTHIVPAIVGSNARAMALCEAALERGVYAQGIRYPSVPEGTARIRFTPVSSHTEEDVQTVLDVFDEVARLHV